MSDTDFSKRAFPSSDGRLASDGKTGSVNRCRPCAGHASLATRALFTPLDCSAFFNASAVDLGWREQAKELCAEAAEDGLIRTPGGA